MSYLQNALMLLMQLATGALVFLMLIRILMRATGVSSFNPIVNFVAKVTNPICRPLGFIPRAGNWDSAALTAAFLIQFIFYVIVVYWIDDKAYNLAGVVVLTLHDVLKIFTDMAFFLILINVILSWVSAGRPNPNMMIFSQMTEPFLAPFRPYLPNLGGIDLSPLAALVVLQILGVLILAPIADWGQSLL